MEIERVALVTGAGSGIGAATVRRLAGPRTALVIHTRQNAEGLRLAAEAAMALGSPVETLLGDVADPAVPAALVARARSAFGRLDQIVSNAGAGRLGRVGEVSAADLETAFAAMPIAFLRLVDAALPDLERSAFGRVVAVSSFVVHGFGTGGLLFPATAAAKAALEALAKTLAVQLAPTGTTVNCVAPGFTRKDPGGHSAAPAGSHAAALAATPSGRLAEPADIAGAIAFLLSREAAHVTGQVLHVDGGLLLP